MITYPAVHQDIAVVVDDDVDGGAGPRPSSPRRGRAAALGEIFDLYRGEQVEPGRKSLALRLEFRAPAARSPTRRSRTVRERITAALAEIGGRCVSERAGPG